jgi:hypothetical protein
MFTGQVTSGLKRAGSLRFYRPKFKYIFCDMDGTLLNSKSQVTARNAEALREARSRGVNIVIATGKVLQVLHFCNNLTVPCQPRPDLLDHPVSTIAASFSKPSQIQVSIIKLALR